MSYDVGCRLGSDPTLLLLWLWRRPAATAPIRLLAWEPPYATDAALKRQKKKKKKKKEKALYPHYSDEDTEAQGDIRSCLVTIDFLSDRKKIWSLASCFLLFPSLHHRHLWSSGKVGKINTFS